MTMFDYKFYTFLLIFLYAGIFEVHAQNQATNIKFVFQKDLLVITYDLPEGNNNLFYKSELRVVDSISHRIITPIHISGDVGLLKGGKRKEIKWAFVEDSIKLSNKLGVFVNIQPVTIRGGPENALRSVIVPGWGDYFVYKKKGNPAFLITIVSYGLVGYGIYNKMQSDKNYSMYHNASRQSDIDNYYNLAQQQQNNFALFTPIGAAIWGADIVNVLIKGYMNQQDRKKTEGLAKLNWNINFDSRYASASLSLKF